MFGLMRAKKCGMSAAEKDFRRLNYCGTCKTIGALYGQKSRFLLNHDTVFLAEILSAVSGEKTDDWQKSYQSFNCLSLPENEMPLPLKFAATTNVILTEFKFADHLVDEKKRRYKFAHNAFSKEFKRAEKHLKEWNFPLEKVRAILETQPKIESELHGTNPAEILENLAQPTAETTAVFFGEAVKLCGRAELIKAFYQIGFAFGKTVYLLDALEDYEKDFRQNQFNAIRAAFELKENKIAPEIKSKVAWLLKTSEAKIASEISNLPLAENQKSLFTSRLAENINRKLKIALPVLSSAKSCVTKPNFKQRWMKATVTARSFARQYSWQMPLVFLFVLAFALVAPAQTKEARSARECFDLSFNLMFLGAIFGSVVSAPKLFMGKFGKPKKAPPQNGGEGSDGGSWCDWCDCDCCEGCCCCCEAGEGGCDCCSGCCDCDCNYCDC